MCGLLSIFWRKQAFVIRNYISNCKEAHFLSKIENTPLDFYSSMQKRWSSFHQEIRPIFLLLYISVGNVSKEIYLHQLLKL